MALENRLEVCVCKVVWAKPLSSVCYRCKEWYRCHHIWQCCFRYSKGVRPALRWKKRRKLSRLLNPFECAICNWLMFVSTSIFEMRSILVRQISSWIERNHRKHDFVRKGSPGSFKSNWLIFNLWHHSIMVYGESQTNLDFSGIIWYSSGEWICLWHKNISSDKRHISLRQVVRWKRIS